MKEYQNMNNLTVKFLNSIRRWIDKRIPEETRDCLRTKIAVVFNINSKEGYDIILAGDYGTYLSYKEQREIYKEYETLKEKEGSLNEEERQRLTELESIIEEVYNGEEMTEEIYNKKVDSLIIDNLISIKADSYSVGDYVIIGYVDNKLTNSFILYKIKKKGV